MACKSILCHCSFYISEASYDTYDMLSIDVTRCAYLSFLSLVTIMQAVPVLHALLKKHSYLMRRWIMCAGKSHPSYQVQQPFPAPKLSKSYIQSHLVMVISAKAWSVPNTD